MVRCVSLMLCLHRKGFGSTFQFSDCMSSSNLQKSSAVLPGMCKPLPVEKLTRLLSLLTTTCTSTSFSTGRFMLFSTSSLLFWSYSLVKWALKFFSSINNVTAGPQIKRFTAFTQPKISATWSSKWTRPCHNALRMGFPFLSK